MADYVQLACMARRSVRLVALGPVGSVGVITIRGGCVWDAEDLIGRGEDAFRRLSVINAGIVPEALAGLHSEQTIHTPWEQLILDAALGAEAVGTGPLKTRKDTTRRLRMNPLPEGHTDFGEESDSPKAQAASVITLSPTVRTTPPAPIPPPRNQARTAGFAPKSNRLATQRWHDRGRVPLAMVVASGVAAIGLWLTRPQNQDRPMALSPRPAAHLSPAPASRKASRVESVLSRASHNQPVETPSARPVAELHGSDSPRAAEPAATTLGSTATAPTRLPLPLRAIPLATAAPAPSSSGKDPTDAPLDLTLADNADSPRASVALVNATFNGMATPAHWNLRLQALRAPLQTCLEQYPDAAMRVVLRIDDTGARHTRVEGAPCSNADACVQAAVSQLVSPVVGHAQPGLLAFDLRLLP